MAKLIYITNTSLDGYIEDAQGGFDWPASDDTYRLFTGLLQQVGTFLYGRRLYEMMAYWGAPVESYPPERRAFAQAWQRPEKWVYSRTLPSIAAPMARRTRLLREFEVEPILALKRATDQLISVGGAELASAALEAGLVDELHVVVHPIWVGGGKPAIKATSHRSFNLIETRPFDTGAVYLRYEVRPVPGA